MDRFEHHVTTSPGFNAEDRARLDDRYFVLTAVLKAALAEAPRIDYERFRAELDAFADQDPTPRCWPEG
jgi:hypothetical protein